jgi:hypothetical protein
MAPAVSAGLHPEPEWAGGKPGRMLPIAGASLDIFPFEHYVSPHPVPAGLTRRIIPLCLPAGGAVGISTRIHDIDRDGLALRVRSDRHRGRRSPAREERELESHRLERFSSPSMPVRRPVAFSIASIAWKG